MGSKDGASGESNKKIIASHQCGQGSNPGVDTTCGLSLLFILSFALKGFFVVLQFSPLLKINISKFQFDQKW